MNYTEGASLFLRYFYQVFPREFCNTASNPIQNALSHSYVRAGARALVGLTVTHLAFNLLDSARTSFGVLAHIAVPVLMANSSLVGGLEESIPEFVKSYFS